MLYAERDGVIEAAAEKGVLAIGNMSDQQAQAPENVITSVVWNMTPTVDYVLDQVAGGRLHGSGPEDFSYLRQGRRDAGADQHCDRRRRPRDLLDRSTRTGRVHPSGPHHRRDAKQADIKSGAFRVDINESAAGQAPSTPRSSARRRPDLTSDRAGPVP